ncbi:MAG: hypothetical protein ACYCTB_01760 [bacterium]
MWLPETEKFLKEFSEYKEINDFAFVDGSRPFKILCQSCIIKL